MLVCCRLTFFATGGGIFEGAYKVHVRGAERSLNTLPFTRTP